MMAAESIYTPANISFEAKVTSMKKVLKALREVKFSLQHIDDPKYADQIGSLKEVQDAKFIIENSLNSAISEMDEVEFARAKKNGTFSKEELAEIMVIQRQKDIKKIRSKQQESSESNTDFKMK